MLFMALQRRKDRNLIGSQVRRIRYKLGLTQEELSAKCQIAGLDISRATLAQIECRYRGVSDIEAWQFAKILKTTVAELYPKKK
jgi:transcriptional regulator with XRE-family HTH domain